MARLMADLSYADAMIGSQYQSTYSSDSLRKLLKQSVLAKHGSRRVGIFHSHRQR